MLGQQRQGQGQEQGEKLQQQHLQQPTELLSSPARIGAGATGTVPQGWEHSRQF